MWAFHAVDRRLPSSFHITASRYGGADRGMRAGVASASVFKIPEMRWRLELDRHVKRELCLFLTDSDSGGSRDILLTVAADFRSEYVVGYHSDAPQRTGKHRVRVELRDKSRGKLRGGEKNFHGAVVTYRKTL